MNSRIFILFIGLLFPYSDLAHSQNPNTTRSIENQSALQREFIYEKAPFPECHASTLIDTPEGIFVAWFGGTEEKHEDVGIWASLRTKDGLWSAPRELFNGVQDKDEKGQSKRFPCWNPVLTRSPTGEIFLFYKVGPSPSEWWGMVAKSQDNGKTWSKGRPLPDGILGPIKNKPIWISPDKLLCPTSTEEGGPWRVYFEETNRELTQWTRTELQSTSDGKGGIQPTILTHRSRLQALCRCDGAGNRVLETWSSDQGKTWSELTPTTLPNPNSGIDGVNLRDGRFLLVYNHTLRTGEFPKGREMLNLAISNDGINWEACEILERAKASEFSYPAIIQSADGQVHLTYTWNRKKIAYVTLDPNKLSTLPIKGLDWPMQPQ